MAGIDGWWEDAFKNGVYPLIAMTRSPLLRGATRREAEFLRRALGLGRGSRVLDLACGAGRHSLELARRGCEVTGLDLSPRYLAEARRRAGRGGVRVRWRLGDMRRLEYRGEFDAAVSLFTSFGYFPRAADDLRVLRGVRRALRPGGLFALDLFNGARVRRHLEQCRRWGWPAASWDETPECGLSLQAPELLRGRGAVRTRWIFLSNGARGRAPCARREMTSFLRIYTKAGLSGLLRRAGFDVVRVLGGFDGSPYDPRRSRRLLVIARRPPGDHASSG